MLTWGQSLTGQALTGKTPKRTLSIKEALALVMSGQPQLQAYREQSAAVKENVSLAKNTLVPKLTAGYQAGYATYNNITGMNYPGLLMPISGPPASRNNYDPVPGSALTTFMDWTPLSFGQRRAAIEKANAEYTLAGSYYDEALFGQQYATLTVYLDAVYLKKWLISQQANIERTRTGLEQSLVLAKEGLRPGIDTAQFQSALAQAQIEWLTVQRSYMDQLAELTRLTGLMESPDQIELSDSLLTTGLPANIDTAADYTTHPAFRYSLAKKELSLSALKESESSWKPTLDIWANLYSRGSGIKADGTVNKGEGWSLTRNNYGAGLQLSFPILGFTRTRIQNRQFRALLRADEAQLSQVALNLQKQIQTARFHYRQNIQIAGYAPVQRKAACYSYEGLQLAYQSGLVDFTRLTQGQYDLLKAETGEAGAYVQVWRSLLDMAVANGNLNLFTDQLK